MKNKPILLILAALVLAVVDVTFFTDWFKPKKIHIMWARSRANPTGINFLLDKGYPLASVEVVNSQEAKTTKFPHALWHVVAAAKPPLITNFNYGAAIPGMKPEVATAVPETLQPQTDYSVIVQTDSGLKATSYFSLK